MQAYRADGVQGPAGRAGQSMQACRGRQRQAEAYRGRACRGMACSGMQGQGMQRQGQAEAGRQAIVLEEGAEEVFEVLVKGGGVGGGYSTRPRKERGIAPILWYGAGEKPAAQTGPLSGAW